MAQSGRERHRDRDPKSRWAAEPARANRVFRITDAERQLIARSLRLIDETRAALEQQQNPANREIIRELRTSADRIYDVLNGVEEMD